MKTIKAILTRQERLDVITTAIESNGIQYWACEYGKILIWRDKDLNIIKAEFDADNQEGEKNHYVVTPRTVQKGVDVILSEDLVRDDIRASILECDNDQESSDCIIQAGLFGELVYG